MTALAARAADLAPAHRARLLAGIPRALQTAAHVQSAAVEATLLGEFYRWAALEGAADQWAAIYTAATSSRAEALYLQTAELVVDYTALATAGTQIPTPPWNGYSRTIAEAPWRWTPVKYLGNLTASGVPRPAAVDRAARNASQLGSLDVAGAQRQAITDAAATSRGLITGQRKQPGAGACGWCSVVAGRTYSASARVPGHANDRCGVVPIVDGDGTNVTPPAGDLEAVLAQPATPALPA